VIIQTATHAPRSTRSVTTTSTLLRLVAAGAVLFSHAFLIADGSEAREPFVVLLGPHNILGLYAVQIFLVISGFLVSRSAVLSSSVGSFLWKRVLRIYPGLIVCALVLGLVGAPLFSTLGPGRFLASGLGVRYAAATPLWPGHLWRIDTVHFYADPTGWLGQVMAGTLWTIPHELFCYLLLALLVVLSMNRLRVLVALFAATMGLRFVPGLWGDDMASQFFLLLLPSFLAGACSGTSAPTRAPGGRSSASPRPSSRASSAPSCCSSRSSRTRSLSR